MPSMTRATETRLREVEAARRLLVDPFEAAQARAAPGYDQNLAIFESLYDEAIALGALPSRDPLEGISVVIALARALRVQAAP